MNRLIVATLALLLAQAAAAFDLQGHRGTRGLMPENTLPSFARALAIGVHTLETDIAITRDGVLVLSHDPALNPDVTRGADGRWLAARGPLIRTLAFEELRRYDVGRINPGSKYARQFPDQQAVDGTPLPTLDELFALVKRSGNPTLRLALETKLSPLAPDDTEAPEPFAKALIAAVRAAGLAQRTSILSFDWRTLAVVQREAPEISTVYLTIQQRSMDNIRAGQPEPSPWTAGLRHADHDSVPKLIRAAGGKVWSAFHGDLSAALVKDAHELGLTVLAWTVNEPADIDRVLDWGVDGIVSDRPDRVREQMARRGMDLPAGVVVKP